MVKDRLHKMVTPKFMVGHPTTAHTHKHGPALKFRKITLIDLVVNNENIMSS